MNNPRYTIESNGRLLDYLAKKIAGMTDEEIQTVRGYKFAAPETPSFETPTAAPVESYDSASFPPEPVTPSGVVPKNIALSVEDSKRNDVLRKWTQAVKEKAFVYIENKTHSSNIKACRYAYDELKDQFVDTHNDLMKRYCQGLSSAVAERLVKQTIVERAAKRLSDKPKLKEKRRATDSLEGETPKKLKEDHTIEVAVLPPPTLPELPPIDDAVMGVQHAEPQPHPHPQPQPPKTVPIADPAVVLSEFSLQGLSQS